MKNSIVGLAFLMALLCSLQLASAARLTLPQWSEKCKIYVLPPFSKYCDIPGSNTTAGTGNGNGTESGNATDASAGAPRSLPIIGSLPLGNLLPLR